MTLVGDPFLAEASAGADPIMPRPRRCYLPRSLKPARHQLGMAEKLEKNWMRRQVNNLRGGPIGRGRRAEASAHGDFRAINS